MNVHKSCTYVEDVYAALKQRNDPRDERLLNYLYKAQELLQDELRKQARELRKAGFTEDELEQFLGTDAPYDRPLHTYPLWIQEQVAKCIKRFPPRLSYRIVKIINGGAR